MEGADRGPAPSGERGDAAERLEPGRIVQRRGGATDAIGRDARLRHRPRHPEDGARPVDDDLQDLLDRRGGVDGERGAGELVKLRGPLPEAGRLTPHLLGLAEELDEDRDLGAQHLGHHRRQDVVDGAQRVPARHVGLVAVGGDEDDGRVLAARTGADQRRGLEAVHDRHVDVEEDDGEVAVEEVLERLLARERLDDVLAQLGEDGLDGDELVRVVVDHQDLATVPHPPP